LRFLYNEMRFLSYLTACICIWMPELQQWTRKTFYVESKAGHVKLYRRGWQGRQQL